MTTINFTNFTIENDVITFTIEYEKYNIFNGDILGEFKNISKLNLKELRVKSVSYNNETSEIIINGGEFIFKYNYIPLTNKNAGYKIIDNTSDNNPLHELFEILYKNFEEHKISF